MGLDASLLDPVLPRLGHGYSGWDYGAANDLFRGPSVSVDFSFRNVNIDRGEDAVGSAISARLGGEPAAGGNAGPTWIGHPLGVDYPLGTFPARYFYLPQQLFPALGLGARG